MSIKILRVITICFIVALFAIKTNSQNVTFTDVAPQLGIDHTTNISFFAGGLSFCDFDLDGLEDLSLSNFGAEIQILNYDGSSYTDIRSQLLISNAHRSQTLVWADYDNDGDKDFFMSDRGNTSRLFRNDGVSTFLDVTASAGLTLLANQTMAAAWADYDNDGWLDIYVGNRAVDQRSYLYHNNGDGTFIDVTIEAGVGDITRLPLAVSFLDYDNDGWQDIYCANDLMGRNTLFRNNTDGTFTDVSVEAGADIIVSGMGIAIGDYDNNGYLDMYVSNMPDGNKLLKNNGDGTFTEVSDQLGVAFNKLCWGVEFFDYDNDTDLDLHVCASDGPGARGDLDNRNILYKNLGNGTFAVATGTGLDIDSSFSYGSAVADYNNDGYLDLAILNAYGTKTQLWKNSGGSNNWFKVNLEGTISNRDGVGSIIEVTLGSQKFIRSTHCGISYQSQNSFTETIGIGQAAVIDTIKIKWPSGIVDIYTNIPAGSTINSIEGETLAQQSAVTFSDVTNQVKINHSYNISFFAGGISFADANGDGLDDITLSSTTGENIQHLRNKTTKFKNITPTMGINETGQSMSVIWADYDNDRDKDLFVTNLGGVNRLYKNNRGAFTDVTAIAGLSLSSDQSTGSAFADYDNDGWLDLYVGQREDLKGNILYHNNGDGTFTEVTVQAKVENIGKLCLTISWLDYNNDGYQDIYCANDLMKGNTLFKNNGNGTFTDVSELSGAGLQMACMGIALGDYNEDGWQDIYLSNGPDGNRMLKNNGNGTFSELAGTLGLNIGKVCWGSNFIDYDNDGDLDLFVSVSDGPTGQGDPSRQNVLFWNKGNGTFAQAVGTGLDVDASYSYGNAIGDYNNDGYQDIAILNANGTKTQLWKNNGGINNWIK
ncbi:MAG: VCBS repeat-containing protein [Ignavibacteriales bacterium]|nr:VCBS repeat-containing protein [Ignavibacteriales bacterium]